MAQRVKNLPAMWETWVGCQGWEHPLEKGMATHSSIPAWRPHGQRSLEGYSPWGCKESDMTEVTKYTQLFLCPEFLVSFPRNDTAPVLLLIVSMLFIRHCVGHISEVVKHHFFKSGKEKPPITSLLMSGFIHQG